MKCFKKLALLFLLLCAISSHAQTAKEEHIDVEYNDCIAKDTSTANISNCAFEAYGKWNKEMQFSYKRLLKTLKKDNDRAALKQSQTAWMAYRDAEFKSYDNMFNLPGGEWTKMRQSGRIATVRARAIQLRNYEEALKKR